MSKGKIEATAAAAAITTATKIIQKKSKIKNLFVHRYITLTRAT